MIRFCFFLFLCCIFCGLTACQKNAQLKETAQTVVVAPVKKELVKRKQTVVGEVVAKKKVFLRARVEGFLEKRNFSEGSFVKKGKLLYSIEPYLYEAKVTAAEAELANNEANLKNKVIDYNRQDYLVKNNAVSKREYDKAAAAKAMAEAQVELSKANLARAKLDLSYTKIYAPFDGRIGSSNYNVGNLVGPLSDPLALIIMVDPIRVAFNISESELVTELQKIFGGDKKPDRSGKAATLDNIIVRLVLSNGTEYPEIGKINFIDNVINPMTGTILLRAIFPNPKSILTPGAYVNVIIEDKEPVEELLIPQAGIQEDQTGKFVMLVDKNNKVRVRNITSGDIYGIYITVQKGLQEGDRVITEGLQKVRPGMKVNPIQEKTPK